MSIGVPSPPTDFMNVEPWREWQARLNDLYARSNGIQKALLADAIRDSAAEIGRIERFRAEHDEVWPEADQRYAALPVPF
ncbi:hypothetical protein AZL_d03630 (plasmid) [Azospirillum sp. B510]|uniref:hypothetical protein n=1 Tax=Azospirillum sp. (strain B510) TaxID=137722 RepID=UPI0001C4C790|nr:hypothetical protein [Azospirillum sp. B510]BAI76189.1 hypothetical protein AZL_d03630 [Azospirillum sp. B510]